MNTRKTAQTANSTSSENKSKKKKSVEFVKLRLDKGDYAKLKIIGKQMGMPASCLIRASIKKMIKTKSMI